MLTLRAYPSWFTFFARALGSCLLMLNTALVSATTLQSIAVKDLPDRTSIFLTLNGLPAYRFFVLQAPLRAVIDFPQTNVNFKINQVSFGHGVIGHMRSGNPNPSTLRIVFDLNHAIDMRVVNWKSGMNGAQGLRVDLVSKEGGVHPSYRERPPLLKPVTRPIALAIPRSIAVPHAIAVHHAPPKSLRDVVVVIDAGHGGKDPGAIGPRRNVEKNVVLGIALKLKQRIDREPGMRAVMTRQGDYYIGLRERLKMARKYNADMFVSIHADAFNNKESNGASVYALSPTGATSEAARWLAEKENYSELGGVNLSGLDDRNGVIRTVLLDLSQTATINTGLQIGDKVLRHLNQMTNLHHNKVEQARFMVLKSPDIPSILVETGFISNPREEFNLTSPAYQMRLSNAIFDGLKHHFFEYPPHGTRLEAMSGGSNYMAPSQWSRLTSRGKSA